MRLAKPLLLRCTNCGELFDITPELKNIGSAYNGDTTLIWHKSGEGTCPICKVLYIVNLTVNESLDGKIIASHEYSLGVDLLEKPTYTNE